MNRAQALEHVQTVVIGGGQAGLSVGYHLARRGLPFLILEANGRVGDSWRNRWDSLRLFTPARYDGLDGMRFPAPADSFPTKDEMAEYLEAYARRFNLPIGTGTRVERVSRQGRRYLVETGDRLIQAEHVVVAMASYQKPRIPEFARELRAEVLQMHSSEYRNARQLREGGVLIVGAGNSGAEIAIEAVRSHRTWLSGRPTGHIPFRIESFVWRKVMVRVIFRLLFHRVLTVRTPIGRKVRPTLVSRGGPLIRVKPAQLAAAGIERVPRVAGLENGLPVLADGRVLDIANLIWCTGFHPGFSWLDLPVFDEAGEPKHESGVVPGEPGLYFVGLHFLHAFSSTMIHGVGRDAERIADGILRRVGATAGQPGAAAA